MILLNIIFILTGGKISLLTIILSSLVALEHIYIMYLETFATTSDSTSRVFNMSKDELERKSVNTLFKNQGVYNGLIAILILISLFIIPSKEWNTILMVYVVLVASYGAITSDPKIIFKQAGLAILSLISLILF
ncbi:DUF1304 domain-containing protein [Pseudostreptobacillus hongkongensis]|uniref:DUF1304 domain-containing protein n=1 Tax=Pseudostreptobacillus hongkongensis TaxID=1162717 RepID=UPI0028D8AA44|nr:DUF1304 domain-containing protein [Pseudostreptobacillus hongkongensis]